MLRYVTLHQIRYVMLRDVALSYVTLRHVTLRYVTLSYITLQYITLHYILWVVGFCRPHQFSPGHFSQQLSYTLK